MENLRAKWAFLRTVYVSRRLVYSCSTRLVRRALQPKLQKPIRFSVQKWWPLCSRSSLEIIRTSFQKCKRKHKIKFPSFSKQGLISWQLTVTPLFKDNEILVRHREKPIANYYSKTMLKEIKQILDSMKYFLQLWKPGNFNSTIQPGTIKEKSVPFNK